MAKLLNKKFKPLNLFLTLILLIVLPIIVFSSMKAPTNLSQFAASLVTNAPQNLKATSSVCLEDASYPVASRFKFSWSSVSGANRYQINWKVIKLSTGKLYNSGNLSASTNYINPQEPFFIDPWYPIYWKVRGYNTYSNSYGPWSYELKLSLTHCRAL